jgi:hypothetical protein
MKFYYFGGVLGSKTSVKSPSNLNDHGFHGVMFTHDIPQGDIFIQTALDIKPNEKIKYLVAIRPYTISPQYLYMLNDSLNKIQKDRVQLNIISGYTKNHENSVKGIVGNVNDQSDKVEKRKYLVEFLESLNEMNSNKDLNYPLDFFVTTTNPRVLDAVNKYNNKIILPYSLYKNDIWFKKFNRPLEVKSKDIMLAITPVIRDTEEELDELKNYALRPIWQEGEVSRVVNDAAYFTPNSFHEFVKDLKKNNIHYMLINAVPQGENDIIIPFIKNYVESTKYKDMVRA